SPTGADGKIYFMDHLGQDFVVAAGDKFELLHQVAMGDKEERYARSSIAAAHGNLFIRTNKRLYCIGK
ncbi:MAG: serine/threonine protein kinase, partial [Verrucomicrobiales bacterium]